MARTKLVQDTTEVRTPPAYEPGNLCYLISGSCRMSVERVLPDGTVVCVWQHYDTKEIMRATFDPVTLSKAQG